MQEIAQASAGSQLVKQRHSQVPVPDKTDVPVTSGRSVYRILRGVKVVNLASGLVKQVTSSSTRRNDAGGSGSGSGGRNGASDETSTTYAPTNAIDGDFLQSSFQPGSSFQSAPLLDIAGADTLKMAATNEWLQVDFLDPLEIAFVKMHFPFRADSHSQLAKSAKTAPASSSSSALHINSSCDDIFRIELSCSLLNIPKTEAKAEAQKVDKAESTENTETISWYTAPPQYTARLNSALWAAAGVACGSSESSFHAEPEPKPEPRDSKPTEPSEPTELLSTVELPCKFLDSEHSEHSGADQPEEDNQNANQKSGLESLNHNQNSKKDNKNRKSAGVRVRARGVFKSKSSSTAASSSSGPDSDSIRLNHSHDVTFVQALLTNAENRLLDEVAALQIRELEIAAFVAPLEERQKHKISESQKNAGQKENRARTRARTARALADGAESVPEEGAADSDSYSDSEIVDVFALELQRGDILLPLDTRLPGEENAESRDSADVKNFNPWVDIGDDMDAQWPIFTAFSQKTGVNAEDLQKRTNVALQDINRFVKFHKFDPVAVSVVSSSKHGKNSANSRNTRFFSGPLHVSPVYSSVSASASAGPDAFQASPAATKSVYSLAKEILAKRLRSCRDSKASACDESSLFVPGGVLLDAAVALPGDKAYPGPKAAAHELAQIAVDLAMMAMIDSSGNSGNAPGSVASLEFPGAASLQSFDPDWSHILSINGTRRRSLQPQSSLRKLQTDLDAITFATTSHFWGGDPRTASDVSEDNENVHIFGAHSSLNLMLDPEADQKSEDSADFRSERKEALQSALERVSGASVAGGEQKAETETETPADTQNRDAHYRALHQLASVAHDAAQTRVLLHAQLMRREMVRFLLYPGSWGIGVTQAHWGTGRGETPSTPPKNLPFLLRKRSLSISSKPSSSGAERPLESGQKSKSKSNSKFRRSGRGTQDVRSTSKVNKSHMKMPTQKSTSKLNTKRRKLASSTAQRRLPSVAAGMSLPGHGWDGRFRVVRKKSSSGASACGSLVQGFVTNSSFAGLK